MKEKMKGYKTGKIGDTDFNIDKTPYANPNAPYAAQRADKKSKFPKREKY